MKRRGFVQTLLSVFTFSGSDILAHHRQWLYVVAVVGAGTEPQDVTFLHTFVEAKTEQDAYRAGFNGTPIAPHVSRINDYVVVLGGK